MKLRRRTAALLLSLALMGSLAPQTFAASAQASIPTYTWELEYRNVDYKNSLYPPLNYKGVTYFPMTWDYCRLLGLSSVWVEGEGLFIASWGSCGLAAGEFGAEDFPTYAAAHNPRTVPVTFPTYPIWVNGKRIDNNREEYPLLNFRGVTYFPMTWRFAREEFNWNTEWSQADNRFAVHYGIDSDWCFTHEVYELTDALTPRENAAAYLVKNISQEVPIGVGENGETIYTTKDSRKFYTLHFATGRLSESEQRASYDVWADGGTQYLPVGYLPEDISIRNEREYTDDSIPAPYTPFVAHGYVRVSGKDYFIGDGVCVTNAVRMGDYVFCNARRYTGWKGWTNPNEELYRIELATGVVERIDTKYENWGSMKILGCDAYGRLYLKCQQGSAVTGGEGGVMEASAYNDGYYCMDDLEHCTARLLRRFVYTDGDIVTPDGHIYGIFDWKNTVERMV